MDSLLMLDNISKHYPRLSRSRDRARGLLQALTGSDSKQGVAVLRDINLSIRRGESMAIVGENGAGKSTLLKLIAGVLHPTEGSITVNGSIAALLELGAGFHPEYTGLQNLRSAASLMGLADADFENALADIVQFSGLEDELNLPVKKYSSGMLARLGFSLLTVVRPDLLISDEVLSVGDESFQKKCIAWLQDYLQQGGTLLLVSHSMYHVQKLCQQACWIDNGRIVESGDVFAVCQAYNSESRKRHAGKLDDIFKREIRIEAIELFDVAGQPVSEIQPEKQVRSCVSFSYSQDQVSSQIRYRLLSADGTVISRLTHMVRDASEAESKSVQADDEDTHLRIERQWCFAGLLPGHYTLEAMAVDDDNQAMSNQARCELIINGKSREFGSLKLPNRWNVA